MNLGIILNVMSILWTFLTLSLSGYFLSTIFFEDHKKHYEENFLFVTLTLTFMISACLIMHFKAKKQIHKLENMKPKEALILVVFAWLSMVFIGAIPYIFIGESFSNSIFESASGFSTTGASILTNIENMDKSLLMWRSFTQWIGGMGIIVFFVAIISALGIAGKMLFRSEVPGPIKENITPHLRDTTRALWLIYLGFTLLLIIILKSFGMSLFDAINHSFTTLSTGGFSTKNQSLGHFSSSLQWITSLFMLIGGINFNLYYLLLFSPNKKVVLKDTEIKWYFSFILIYSLFFSFFLYFNDYNDLEKSFRIGFFTIISLVTTSGFSNTDYEQFHFFLQALLLITFFTGGSASSTSGGMKFYRIVLIFKALSQEIKHSIQPRLISSIKIAGKIVPKDVTEKVFVFVSVYFMTVGVASILFMMNGIDFVTAFSIAMTCIGNIGPGFGSVGPSENFAHFSNYTKFLAAFFMVLGRLEFFTLLAVLHPSFWKK